MRADAVADRTLDEVLGLVLAATARGLPWVPAPRALTPSIPRRTHAVDGSSGVLVQNGNAWVVAVRAAVATWPGPRTESPVALHATVPDAAGELLEEAWSRHGLAAGPAPRSADAFAEAWRALAEHEALRATVAAAVPGDLLLVDGALHGLPRHEQDAMDRILDGAQRGGVVVAGVAKRSALSEGGLPLVPRVHHHVAASGGVGPWAVPVPGRPGVWVALLHGAAPQAFRVDASEEALPLLAGLSRDAAYPGYPYPLAVAHNTVALTAARLHRERGRLESAIRRRGGAQAWAWLRDFHAVLDRNVPG